MAPVLIARWRRRTFFVMIGALAAILLDTSIDPHLPHIGLATRANDQAEGYALIILPIIAAIVGLPATQITQRGPRLSSPLTLWLAALSATFCGVYVTAAGSWAAAGLGPPTFISTGRYTLAVYHFGGATSEGGGVVDQVCRLTPDLVIAKQIYERDPGAGAVATVLIAATTANRGGETARTPESA